MFPREKHLARYKSRMLAMAPAIKNAGNPVLARSGCVVNRSLTDQWMRFSACTNFAVLARTSPRGFLFPSQCFYQQSKSVKITHLVRSIYSITQK